MISMKPIHILILNYCELKRLDHDTGNCTFQKEVGLCRIMAESIYSVCSIQIGIPSTKEVRVEVNRKKMGFADRAIFILGMTLAGVIAFILVAGVIIAILKFFYMDSKKQSVQIHSVPMLDDEPKEALIAAPFEQRLAEAIQLHDEAMAGNADTVRIANLIFERLRLDHPGHAIADAYHGSVMVLLAMDMDNPIERKERARSGLMLLDEAVASSPQDRTIRMLRVTSASRLPERPFYHAETAIEDYIFLIEEDLRQPGSLDTETYTNIIGELGEAYRQVDRHQEAEYCLSMLNKKRPAN